MLGFLAAAFGAGLATLLTPCVFPMIPVTLAFFTKQSTTKEGDVDRASVVKLALMYCAGIVLSFLAIGIGFALAVGKSGAYRFATSPVVNLIFATLFVLFGLAMLELFELRLPSKLQSLTAGRRGGALGVLFMGLTFVVSAFTCTAPILGSIVSLAAGAHGSAEALLRPILGMTAFSLALALPFFVLALFPPLLSKLPRSGAWMSTVKGAFGFLELAASLKFLSNADLAWRWTVLPREVFLNLSAMTLLAGGLWLLGKLTIGSSTPSGKPTIARGIWAGIYFAGAVYAMYGVVRPMDSLMESYVPPYRAAGEQRASAGEPVWNRDLEAAKKLAKETGKRVLIDFTGHTCVNCRFVEQNIFTDKGAPRPEINAALNRFVLARLYVDPGAHAEAAEAEKNYDYEDKGFQEIAQPVYGVIEPDGTFVGKATFPDVKTVDSMKAFLEKLAK